MRIAAKKIADLLVLESVKLPDTSRMSLYSEHDDLDLRGVVVNWQKEISCGSFGVIFEGTWRDDTGNSCDVVVKVSARMRYATDSKTTDAVLNGTLRCSSCLLHFWGEIRTRFTRIPGIPHSCFQVRSGAAAAAAFYPRRQTVRYGASHHQAPILLQLLLSTLHSFPRGQNLSERLASEAASNPRPRRTFFFSLAKDAQQKLGCPAAAALPPARRWQLPVPTRLATRKQRGHERTFFVENRRPGDRRMLFARCNHNSILLAVASAIEI